jgi:anti-sigma regulatory factor (Ser/Thr protein kinase)
VTAVGRTIQLQIPPRTDHLALVRRVVASAAATTRDLPAQRIDDLSLAVSEACANAIEAQRAVGAELPVAVRIDLAGGAVTVTITDHAGGFSPDEVDPIPDPGDPGRLRHEHGLGLPLIRSLAQSVRFAPTPDGTAVQIVVGPATPDRRAGADSPDEV